MASKSDKRREQYRTSSFTALLVGIMEPSCRRWKFIPTIKTAEIHFWEGG